MILPSIPVTIPAPAKQSPNPTATSLNGSIRCIMLARKVTVLFSKIAFASMEYPPQIIRNANTAEINPNSNP